MYKYCELHNHSTESDGSMNVQELIHCMAENKTDVFALTDHNTISGHQKVQAVLQQETFSLECIYGMEYTTYYGHILCLNLPRYVPWEDINMHTAEKLFAAVKQTGAIAGVAHPFSYGAPLAQGCNWEMRINDYTQLDFIEIINNSEPLELINEKAIHWWESLCLRGLRIAMSCGMDLHAKKNFSGCFGVYIDAKKGETAAKALHRAVTRQKTYITRGPVFKSRILPKRYSIQSIITDVIKPGFSVEKVPFWTIEYTCPSQTRYKKISTCSKRTEVPLSDFTDSSVIITKLYAGEAKIGNLTAIAPVLYR